MPSTTVNPSLLSSLPSPSTSAAASPSSSTDGPPRKRPRSELTSEERKEARAHRNRIAAQNSRDRRKAHYSQLEQRIAELEEENRQLKAGQMNFSAPPRRSEEEEQERDKARERENEELKERIKTLEKGWDAVVKALAAQGLPTGIPAPPSATTATADSSTQPQSSSTFPIIVPNSSIFPISPASSNASLSTSSFDFEFDVVESESTRHLAAGGQTTNQPKLSLELSQHSHTTNQHQESDAVSDAAMEDLFREILEPCPISPTAASSLPLPLESPTTSTQFQMLSAPTPAQMMMVTRNSVVDWESEAEMQRLLDMLPDVQPTSFDDGIIHGHPALEFDLESEWDLERSSTTMGTGIGVF